VVVSNQRSAKDFACVDVEMCARRVSQLRLMGIVVDAAEDIDERPIRAAGGILRRMVTGEPEIAVIHRPRYCDWSLPKGKLKTGETWEAAALREVQEETGYRATMTSLAGPLVYYVNGRLKIVLLWNMQVDGDTLLPRSKEVDACQWLSPAAAYARMTYPIERRLLADMFPGQF
jgi:8-oxo-dGTP diphosphatase